MSNFVSGACRVLPGGTREHSFVEQVERAHLHAAVHGYRGHATEAQKASYRRQFAEKDLPNKPTRTGIGGQISFNFG